jgi:UDP-N-acetylglucosamine acyltransferase
MAIHATAMVDRTAEIDSSVEVGPYAIIEGHVKIGADTHIFPHAFVGQYTTLGERCEIHPFAVVGHVPQDLSFDGSVTYACIGNDTTVREGATIHRAAIPGATTRVGDHCLIMSVAHVGHDCVIGNNVKLANSALIAGHVIIHDRAFVSGNSAVHQFVRIGELVIVGGGLRVSTDVLPFMMQGPEGIIGPNVIGMRRAGHTAEDRQEIRLCHRILFRTNRTFSEATEEIARVVTTEPGRKLVAFLREPSKRGFEGLRHRPRHRREDSHRA